MAYLQSFSHWACFFLLLWNTGIYAQHTEALTKSTFGVTSLGDDVLLNLKDTSINGELSVMINDEKVSVSSAKGMATLDLKIDKKGQLFSISIPSFNQGHHSLYHISKRKDLSLRVRVIPKWYAILPPFIAIALALIFKEVIVSLFAGIWAGAFIIGGLRVNSFYYWMLSFFEVVQNYIINALSNTGHLSVIVFSLLIGGMVALISKNGGMQGVVLVFSRYARSARSTQFMTWFLGVAIFFDDYANTLIVGNTMRSLTDQFKISREKLAYLVDSTAAPVSSVAFITTWIGAELGFIDSGLSQLHNFNMEVTPYAVFFSSLKYSFYPVLTLVFILLIIFLRRDFGPMYKAEIRARRTGMIKSASQQKHDEPDMEDLTPVQSAPMKWSHAAFPVFTVIAMTIFGLLDTGFDASYRQLMEVGATLPDMKWSSIWENLPLLHPDGLGFFSKLGLIIGAADSYVALLWASLAGLSLAVVITIYNKTMNLFNTMHWVATGFKTMIPALIILILAWALAQTTESLHTAEFLTQILEGNIHPLLLPVLVFLLAAAVSFSTGSSWSTMAILYPLTIPLTWSICQFHGLDDTLSFEILLNVIANVIAASVLGDHCSPISDTTILSSLASDCNHIDHVKTQMPYALTVGLISIICVGLSTYFGGGWGISAILFLAGITCCYFIVMKWGKRI